jgi:hypothetical protein
MSVVEEGQLKGSFRGFKNRDTVFASSRAVRGDRNTTSNNTATRTCPHARVVERNGGYELEVDSMSDTVEVVRVR